MSKYTTQIEHMTHSFSRLSSYEQCPYYYYLYYLCKDEDGKRLYEPIGNFYSEYGSMHHEIFENLLKGNTTIDKEIDEYDINYEARLTGMIRPSLFNKYYYMGINAISNFDIDKLTEGKPILGVEKEIHTTVGEYPIIGYIDLLCGDSNEITIIDHKSAKSVLGKRGGVLKNQQGKLVEYKRQLYLYSKAVIEEYGHCEYLEWNFFNYDQTYKIPWNKDEYEEAIAWAINTIETIKTDEDFEPITDYFFCRNICGYRHECPYLNGEEDDEAEISA